MPTPSRPRENDDGLNPYVTFRLLKHYGWCAPRTALGPGLGAIRVTLGTLRRPLASTWGGVGILNLINDLLALGLPGSPQAHVPRRRSLACVLRGQSRPGCVVAPFSVRGAGVLRLVRLRVWL